MFSNRPTPPLPSRQEKYKAARKPMFWEQNHAVWQAHNPFKNDSNCFEFCSLLMVLVQIFLALIFYFL